MAVFPIRFTTGVRQKSAPFSRWFRPVLVLAVLIACFGPGARQAACDVRDPIRLAVSLGLSGRFAVMSDAIFKGLKLWESHINAEGGILGRSVSVIVEDDHSDPAIAQKLYRRFIQTDRVDFLFAPYSSLITEAVLPIAEAHGIPTLISGAAADRLWEKELRNAIGIYTPASKFPLGFLELVVLHDLDHIGIVYANDAFSTDLAESSRKWAKRFGLSVTVYASFDKGTVDLAPLAQTAKDSGTRVLMVCGHMNEAVNMTRSLKRIDWRPQAFYASVGPALAGFYDQCGPDTENVFATSLWEPRANYPGAQKFENDFIAAYHSPPGYHAGLAYAAGQVLREAITEAGSCDRDRVRAILFKMDTMTIIGRFGVDSTGKQIRQHTFIIQWQDGRKALVWPEAIKTAEPRF